VSEWKPLIKDNAKTTYTVADLEPSKAFVFKVTAKNEYGTSEVSQELTVPDRMKDCKWNQILMLTGRKSP
jgi:hypothetical protein